MEQQTKREQVRTGQSIIGKSRAPESMQTRQDPWADADFYGADASSENITCIEPGQAVCGYFRGIRQADNKFGSLYLTMETEDGVKFRLFAPRHLAGQLIELPKGQLPKKFDLSSCERRVEIGTYVELTYRGVEVNPNGEDETDTYKHWDVLVPSEASLN